jgi:sugar lactone lactonase YvrE
MLRQILIYLGIILFSFQIPAQESKLVQYLKHQKEALQAEQHGEYELAVKNYLRMLAMIPHKPEANYAVARVQAVMGNNQEALIFLEKALSLGYPLRSGLDKSFDALEENPGFKKIQTMIEELKKPVGPNRVAFTIAEKDLLPEGIAYDPIEEWFFLGSIWKSKIIKIDRQGKAHDFVTEKQDGLRSAAGMKVDTVNRVLWASSFVAQPWGKVAPKEVGWSGLFKYDLKSGKLIKKYEVPDRSSGHLFNDLTLSPSGDIFITDSLRSEIWVIHHENDTLKLFLHSDEFMYTNGITMGQDDRTLYVSSPGNGVFRIDIPSKESRIVSHPRNMTLSGIDGLYYYDNSLIGIQPSYDRVCRFYMNTQGNCVERMEILEAYNPLFNFPTTGCLVGQTFYYIANSQAYSFNQDGTLFPLDRLKEVVILYIELD